MPTPPVLTDAQRRQAYEYSLQLRQERAELKRLLSAGEMTLRVALTYPQVRGMKVRQLLLALPGIADRRARRALEESGINPAHTVAQCGPLQLDRLLRHLEQ